MEPVLAELPRGLVAAWVVLLGATVGSFLNVVIARVPAGLSVVRPRSRCPRCQAGIAWYDNVPVVSWLVLRGRCRSCALPISIRYPVVEALVAGAAWLAWSRHGLSLAALGELTFTALLLALAAIDLDTWLLPHALTWPLIALGLAASWLGVSPAATLQASALGAGIGFGLFALVSVVGEKVLKKEALGFGDVFLLGGLGAWLGVAAILPVILLSSIQGAVIGLVLIWLGRSQPGPAEAAAEPASEEEWVPPKHALPFGPFLALAALEWLYLGDLLARLVPALEVFR